MVNIIHLQKVNALNPLCQVKGHEESCLGQFYSTSKTEGSEALGLTMMAVEKGP